MQKFYLSVFIFLLAIFLPVGTQAQKKNISDSIYQMNEVVVEAHPFQAVIPSQKLSGHQLQQLNSNSVADAIRYFSGVQIKDFGGMGGLKTINVRNMGTQHVGVFYDGIQLGNAQNGTVDLGRFSLDDLEEISLYNGQKSEIFQSAKDFNSASSIYLRSRKPRFKENKSTNLTAKLKLGSMGLVNPSFRVEQKLSNAFSASFSGEYINSDGEYKFRYRRKKTDGSIAYDTTAIRKNSDIESYRLEGGLHGAVAHGFLEAKLYYYSSDRGLPGSIVNSVFKHGGRLKDENLFAQSAYHKEITNRYKIKAQAKFAFDYTMHKGEDFSINKYYQQEVYFSLVNMYTLTSWWDISLSADYQYSKMNATLDEFVYPTRNSLYVSLAHAIDLGKVKAQASVLSTFAKEDRKSAGKGGSPDSKLPKQSELAPALFLGYQPFEKYNLNIRAFYKRIFRMPTFNDLYYDAVLTAKVKPEFTNQFDIGLTYNKPFNNKYIKELNLQADVYYLNVTDKIVAIPVGGDNFRWTTVNYGKVKSKGIDASAGVVSQINQVEINTNLTYSYSDAQNLEDKDLTYYGDQLPYTPWHSGSAIVQSSYRTWGFNYSYVYVGRRYNNVNNTANNELKPWQTHDVSLQKTFEYKQYKIKGALEFSNLMNQHYEVVYNYPMPGRTFKFIVNIEL